VKLDDLTRRELLLNRGERGENGMHGGGSDGLNGSIRGRDGSAYSDKGNNGPAAVRSRKALDV
jgi:hypothetical protein